MSSEPLYDTMPLVNRGIPNNSLLRELTLYACFFGTMKEFNLECIHAPDTATTLGSTVVHQNWGSFVSLEI